MAKNDTNETACPVCWIIDQFAGSEAGKHLKNSKREFLLAARAFIDGRIKALSDEDEPDDVAKKVDVK